jgi:hypothetical protein
MSQGALPPGPPPSPPLDPELPEAPLDPEPLPELLPELEVLPDPELLELPVDPDVGQWQPAVKPVSELANETRQVPVRARRDGFLDQPPLLGMTPERTSGP